LTTILFELEINMKHLLNLLNRLFPHDKALHFLAGTIAASLGALVGAHMSDGDMLLGSVTMAFVLGALKELVDAIGNYRARRQYLPKPHEISSADLWYTVAGSIPVALPLLAMRLSA
jgi:hypothetical protein